MTPDGVVFASKLTKKVSLDKHFCFRFGTKGIIFCLQMRKGVADSKKGKSLSKKEIKIQLLDSMVKDEVAEFENLNKKAKEVQDPEEAAEIIKRYEDVIKTKKKGIMKVAYHKDRFLKDLKKRKSLLSLSVNQ